MYFARRSLIPLLLIGILLASCGGQSAGDPTPDIDATIAVAAETFAASLFQTQTAMAPTITNTAPPTVTPLPTSSPLALPSPIASATQFFLPNTTIPLSTGTFYTLTPNPSTLSYGCNNLALVRDVTYPSGSIVLPSTTFIKTWQVANTGTCDWLYLYELVFVSGDRMGGNSRRLSDRVPPKEWRQFSVELDAPKEPGTYTGNWRLSDGAGNTFGATLVVSIVVKAPTKTPKPTSYP
jgi:Ig-like domain from next to BRCA1 gene